MMLVESTSSPGASPTATALIDTPHDAELPIWGTSVEEEGQSQNR
jgi:hypothetical protein